MRALQSVAAHCGRQREQTTPSGFGLFAAAARTRPSLMGQWKNPGSFSRCERSQHLGPTLEVEAQAGRRHALGRKQRWTERNGRKVTTLESEPQRPCGRSELNVTEGQRRVRVASAIADRLMVCATSRARDNGASAAYQAEIVTVASGRTCRERYSSAIAATMILADKAHPIRALTAATAQCGYSVMAARTLHPAQPCCLTFRWTATMPTAVLFV
jgi:hypothetical protein